MERINGIDTVDIGGGKRGFRSQNALAGINGTELTDAFLNSVQEEMCTVIEKAGIELDQSDNEQLFKALQKIVTPGFANRLAWMPVLSVSMTAPPAGPVLGDTYVIPAGATGAWAGKAQQLAEWNGMSWNIIPTKDGHGVSLPDGRAFERIGGDYVEKFALDVQSGKWNFAVAGGTANAMTATLAPDIGSYNAGLAVTIVPIAANTSVAPTLALNGLPPKTIIRANGLSLLAGEIIAGVPQSFLYSAAHDKFVIVGTSPSMLEAKLPYMMKTGLTVLPASGTTVTYKAVAFDVAFPNRCIGVAVTSNGPVSTEGSVGIAWANDINRTGVLLSLDTNLTKVINIAVPVSYIAFGD